MGDLTSKHKWFLCIGIVCSVSILLWLIIVPSVTETPFILSYSVQRFSIILFVIFVAFTFITGLVKLKTRFVSKSLSILLSSNWAFFTSLVMVLVTIAGTIFLYTYREGVDGFLAGRILPLLCLVFIIFLEILMFHQTINQIGNSFTLSKKQKIYVLVTLILLGFIIATFIALINEFYLGRAYPYNTFLFKPENRYSDFYSVVNESIGFNPYLGQKSGQYPVLLLIGGVFSLLPPPYSYLLYIILFCVIFFIVSFHSLQSDRKITKIISVFILTFLTYPFLLILDRGNLESLVFLFLLLFIVFYSKKRYTLASVFLASATVLKIYPAIFILLLVKDRKFKELALWAVISAVTTFLCLLIFKGGLSANFNYLIGFSNISNNPNFLSFISIEEGTLTQRGVTLLTLLKIIILQGQISLPLDIIENFSTIYPILAVLLFLPILFYVVFIENSLWRNVALLTIAMLLLPNISADYKLIHLLLPVLVFLRAENSSKLDLPYVILFGLLLIPKNYYYFSRIVSDANARDISIGVPVNIILLIILGMIIIISGCLEYKKTNPKAQLNVETADFSK